LIPKSEHLRTGWIARRHNLHLLDNNQECESRPFLIGLYH